MKGQHEYTALLTEVDHAQREIRAREDELLQIEETLSLARADEEALAATSGEEEAGYEQQMAEWRAEQAKLSAEITVAEKAAAEIRTTIEKRLMGVFDRIAKMRSGVAVARVAMVAAQTAACSSCNVRLRPQLLSDLRLSHEILQCESCKRILYWDGSGLP